MLHPTALQPLQAATLSILLVAALSAAAQAETWVITDSQHPVHGQPDRLILLDAPEQLEADLSADLPSNPEQAAAQAKQRLNAGGRGLQQRLADAYQGVTDAWSLGITKIPAIIIDQRYVLYGERDVETAKAKVQRFLRGQR